MFIQELFTAENIQKTQLHNDEIRLELFLKNRIISMQVEKSYKQFFILSSELRQKFKSQVNELQKILRLERNVSNAYSSFNSHTMNNISTLANISQAIDDIQDLQPQNNISITTNFISL